MKKKYLIAIILILIIVIISSILISKRKNDTNSSDKIFLSSELFTDRDLEQTADTSKATTYTVSNNNDINITKSGVYIITGTANNATIYVEVSDDDKVQLILDNLNISNETMPCIYVKTADKVFITSVNNNTLKVTGTFVSDSSNNLNGVIFSKQDVTFNGTGRLSLKNNIEKIP